MPEGGVVLRRLLGLSLELAQDSLDHGAADLGHQGVGLQHLAADVERQVLGIDDAAQESQVGRHQPGAVVGDEHPLDVELQLVLPLGLIQVERPARRHEEETAVLDHPFRLEMQMHPGIVEAMADVVIELLVLFLADLGLGPGPERRGLVEGRLRAIGLLLVQHDGDRDMIGIGGHDAADLVRREEPLLPFLQGERDLGPAGQVTIALRHVETALAVRAPEPGLVLAGLAADHLDFFGDHEGGIETDAELADLAHVRLAPLELLDEGGGARLGDRAEIFDHLVAVHADAVVADRQAPAGLFGGDADLEIRIVGDQIGLGDGGVSQPVAGVRRVRDQLAQEYLLVRVQGVRNDVEKAADLGLKGKRFCCHARPSPGLARTRGRSPAGLADNRKTGQICDTTPRPATP